MEHPVAGNEAFNSTMVSDGQFSLCVDLISKNRRQSDVDIVSREPS